MTRPKWKRWVLLALLVVLLVQCAMAARPFDQTYAVFTENHGRIDGGEQFGIAVGMPLHRARAELARRGWRETPPHVVEVLERARPCFGNVRGEGELVLDFKDHSWRNGTICLLVANEEVLSVYWIFSPFVI